jgi:thiamine-phosphate pyrophosphorylase
LACALPPLVLLTDDERLADPCAAARRLPPGSLVVVRSRDAVRRAEWARSLLNVARGRGLQLVVAADPELAARVEADGVHFPEARMGDAARWRVRRPDWLITCAAHSLHACARAQGARADAVFLAPVFATRSHPGRGYLGLFRASAIARLTPLPVYALGGIDARTAVRLAPGSFAGIAAVEALSAAC